MSDHYRIPIVYYHSIGFINSNWTRSFLTLKLTFFKDQVKYYSKNYNSVSLKEYWEIKNGFRKPVKNPIVITFDDGYLDNWIWAFPLLKKFGLKATIFVSPEFVDKINGIRPNLIDLEKGEVSHNEIETWGYLSWEEMKAMEESGLIDIQSHTMTHTKYFVSDRLIDLHHPGADALNAIGNLFPDRKPYCISDRSFEKLIPSGYPLFEESSSVIAKKVTINNDFTNECVSLFKDYDFANYKFQDAFKIVQPVYNSYLNRNTLISSIESDDSYHKRLDYEISGSKEIIEQNLNKKVEFLCWPHGDNNEFVHNIALKAGYLATTSGSKQKFPDSPDRIPERIGIFNSKNNRILSKLKTRYRINSYLGNFPYSTVSRTYNYFKYGNFQNL